MPAYPAAMFDWLTSGAAGTVRASVFRRIDFMALIVQKYGGTSVANLDKIRNVADRVIRAKEGGNNLVVVLSAMAGETDRLIGLANQASESKPDEREYDALIATGEQVTVTLLALTLNRLGHKARSFLAHQVKIHTDRAHMKARILKVDTREIEKELKKGHVVVVAGFQGKIIPGFVPRFFEGPLPCPGLVSL